MTITDEMAKAIELIETTNEPVYITGKAGTGKTTLLKYIVDVIRKKFVITAPTGVAAINAGGITLHSLLHIPFGCLTASTSIGNLPYDRKKLINDIDAIIIDEVSMVRPDLMDFIDRKLRAYRVCDRPFGGVQLIMFGDLYQLPPVVKSDEKPILAQSYKGQYFFNAHVFKHAGFNVVELTHIFRQSDPKFINILNNIREYNFTTEDMDELANLKDKAEADNFNTSSIHICTHKKDVQEINSGLLGEPTDIFSATFEGKFNPNAAPCDIDLRLRIGARVMMLVNDHKVGYCNGSLGYVTNITADKITVNLDDVGSVVVEQHVWEAIEYKVRDNKIEREVVGTCKQFPLSLAWAITIHKSQGLTFDKVTIHSKHTFCPGQIYVALSRCTSLEGITIDSYITKRHILPDNGLLRFQQALKTTNGQFTQETYNLINV